MDRMYKKHLAKRITGTTLAKGQNNGAVSVSVEPFAYGTFASWFRRPNRRQRALKEQNFVVRQLNKRSELLSRLKDLTSN